MSLQQIKKSFSPEFHDIYIAGKYNTARNTCRAFAERGTCVNVSETTYIYKGGEEKGVKVSFLTYPRFPEYKGMVMRNDAIDLGMLLMKDLRQESFMIHSHDGTVWFSQREIEEE